MFNDPIVQMLGVALIAIMVGPSLLKFIWINLEYGFHRVSRQIRQWMWAWKMRRAFSPLKKRIDQLCRLTIKLETTERELGLVILLASFDEVGI